MESKVFREFLLSKNFQNYEEKFPTIEKIFYIKRYGFPYISATYINGFVKDMPIRKKQFEEIEKNLNLLTSSCFLKSWKSLFKQNGV